MDFIREMRCRAEAGFFATVIPLSVGIGDLDGELDISPARVVWVGHAFLIGDAGIFDVIFQALTGALINVISDRASRKHGDGNKDDGKETESFHVQGSLQETA
jgi:hypothetical protein